MAETVLERVARAIMVNRVGGACFVKDWRKEAAENAHVAQALAQARAAIEILREPTETMCDAGAEAHGAWGFGASDAAIVFPAMIDAALAKGDER